MLTRKPALLALTLLASLPACGEGSGAGLECSEEVAPTLLVGTATFEGETQQFDEATGVITICSHLPAPIALSSGARSSRARC